MLAVNYTNLRDNMKRYMDQVTDDYETMIVTRKNNKNVVILSEETYNNLDLTGFYWLEESTAKCGDLPKDVSEYIHQLDKRFYWIPYWNASGYNLWKKLGFDTAFLQQNHFFS